MQRGFYELSIGLRKPDTLAAPWIFSSDFSKRLIEILRIFGRFNLARGFDKACMALGVSEFRRFRLSFEFFH
jgi:hypothetical protein